MPPRLKFRSPWTDRYPALSSRPEDYPQLLAAGINDWGGISPVTRDFINPEAAWPQIAILKERTEAAGFALRERLAIYPQFARGHFVDARLMPALDKQRSGDFYAREDE